MSLTSKDILELIGDRYIAEIKIAAIQTGPTTFGYSGLEDSDQIKSLDYIIHDDNTLVIILPGYTRYIESGRRAFTKKVPIYIILRQMRRKRITGDQSTAFRIQNAIYLRGIRPRPFLNEAFENVNKFLVNIEGTIINNILKDFNKIIISQ